MHVRLALSIALLSMARVSASEVYAVDPDESVFAVITQRGGIAARMAHDHFIAAAKYNATVEVTDDIVSGFIFECKTTDLLVDDPGLKDRWSSDLIGASVLESSFKAIPADDRDTIRDHMLDKDQLDARQFPDIGATIVSITERENEYHGKTYSHLAKLKFTVHGKTVTRDISANIAVTEDQIVVESTAAFRFTEFGIKPYSALFGAVKNLDEFFVYCSLRAQRATDAGAIEIE